MLKSVPVDQVKEWQANFLSLLRNSHAELLKQIREGKYSDEIVDQLKTIINDTTAQYN